MLDLVTRPATTADTIAIYELIAAGERDLTGGVAVSLDGIVANLTLPTVDLARDTLLVFGLTGELLGHAWINLGRRAEAHVRPDYLGRGLGGQLLEWTERRARELGSTRLGQTIRDDNTAAIGLMRTRGYEPLATSWFLRTVMTTEPTVPEPPADIMIRPFLHGDEQLVYRMIEDAFSEWQQRPRTYAEWARRTVDRATFTPVLSPLAFHGDQLVGAVLSLDRGDAADGYVERIAVHRSYRNRGIARTLLWHTFRGFYRHGRRSCALWTHSNTGALTFYERVGMRVQRSSTYVSRALVGVSPGSPVPGVIGGPAQG